MLLYPRYPLRVYVIFSEITLCISPFFVPLMFYFLFIIMTIWVFFITISVAFRLVSISCSEISLCVSYISSSKNLPSQMDIIHQDIHLEPHMSPPQLGMWSWGVLISSVCIELFYLCHILEMIILLLFLTLCKFIYFNIYSTVSTLTIGSS